ncbi:8086_t:CDS:2 [Cetraspora pellucida]|uniref:8086_t:CDS:1 n=1 Tax=Cetraspora pellucida TaxID=1433469 RepID=A0ACA9JWD1_9GLOM|nr:8086_t:CDS:2 [Cetraspora pellucida]
MSVNSPLPNRKNQVNNGKQAQVQDPDIFELILPEITAGFKNLAVYLSGVKSVLVEETEEEEESVIRKLKKNLDNEALTDDQKNHVSNILSKEVDVFAETVDDLGQMSAYVHEINTGNAFLIKQVPYHAASSVCNFIKNEIKKLKVKGHIIGREDIHPDEGKVEKTLCEAITKLIENIVDWDLLILSVLFNYRTAQNSATRMSPFLLVYGYEEKLPIYSCQEGETLKGTILQKTFDLVNVVPTLCKKAIQ